MENLLTDPNAERRRNRGMRRRIWQKKCSMTPESPPFVALYGDLGVGKTAFVRGFASVIAPGVTVRSPTFALVNEYQRKAAPALPFRHVPHHGRGRPAVHRLLRLPRPPGHLSGGMEREHPLRPARRLRPGGSCARTTQDKPDSRTLTIEQIGGAGA